MRNPCDYPPIWLLSFLAVARVSAVAAGAARGFGVELLQFVGGLLTGAGLLIVALSVLAFRQARTTIHPHGDPSALIDSGIFAYSRNPIYLAMVAILAGLSLWWGSILGLILTPVLWKVYDSRFVMPEEARMRDRFGDAFTRYCDRVRRWV